MSDTSDQTTIVVGASRGLGRGIAQAFAQAGAPVVALARSADALSSLAGETGSIEIEVADAADATVAATVLARHDPSTVVVVAGATPVMRPLQHQTWETFSVNWHADVRIAFHSTAPGEVGSLLRRSGCARPCPSRCGPALA